MSLISEIANELHVPATMLEKALEYSRILVKHISLPKKDGTSRKVYQPSKKLKLIQYWLINNIFQQLKVHESATAYLSGISIKDNAKKHQKNRYLLKLDLKDFFPSIKYSDIEPIITEWHDMKKMDYAIKELLYIVKKSCFYKHDKLPIGYPSSPIISNIVMYKFDEIVVQGLRNNKDEYGKAVYTRYADDMIFSTNKGGACKNIKLFIEETISSLNSPKLKINTQKSRFISATSGSAYVTGLRICHDKHITIHREYKNRIRLLIHFLIKGYLEGSGIAELKGHLSYIQHVDPVYFTKIQSKHFSSLRNM